MEQNQEHVKFSKQVSYVIGANIAILFLGFIQLPILTKGLGATLYGTWSLINVTISLILPLALLTFGVSIVRFLTAEKDKNKIREDFFSACCAVFISGTVFSVLLFLFSDYLAVSILRDIGSSFYIKLASILVLFNSLDTLTLAFFRMRRQIGLHTIFNLSRNTFQVGLIIISILLGYKLTGVIVAVIVSGALFFLVKIFIILKQIGFQFPRFSNIKSYLKWGIPLIPNSAILWIIHTSDRYMVSYFMGVAAAGIYSAAYGIGKYASFILMPLGVVLYPTIIKLYDGGNSSETKKYLKYSLKYFIAIAIPCAFGLSVLSKPILKILTTPEFVAGKSVVPFVALGAVLFGFYQICIYIIHLVNKTHITVRLLGTSAALNIILNLILIPRMGIVGAAIATLVAYGVLGILTLVVTRRYLKFDIGLPFIGKSIFASAIMAFCIWMIHPVSIVPVIISIFAGAIIYFGTLFLIKGLSSKEMTFFLGFVKHYLGKIHT